MQTHLTVIMEPIKPGTSKTKRVAKPKEMLQATTDPKPKTSKEDPVRSKARQSIYDIVHQAIGTLGTSNKGVSLQAIKKHVYGIKGDDKKFDTFIKKAIIKGFENGVFAKPKNKEFTGASGSFVLVKKKVVSKNSEKLKQKNNDVEEHVSDSEAVTKKPIKIRKRNLSDSAIEGIRPNNCSTSTPKIHNRLTKIITKKAPKVTGNKTAKSKKEEMNEMKEEMNEKKEEMNEKKEEMNEKKDSPDSEVAVKRKINLSMTSDASDKELDFVKEKKTTKTNVGMKKKPKTAEPKVADPIAAKGKKLFNASEKVEKKIIKTTKSTKKTT